MTYMHEHLRVDLSKEKGDRDCLLDDFDAIGQELIGLAKRGLRRIVDVSCRGMGRDYDYLERMERFTGLTILISTGFYKEPFLPKEALEADEKTLTALFISDIRNGCESSNRRAALIGEIGTSLGVMTPAEAKIFRAAAGACRETGVPLSTHTTLGTLGFEQVRFLKQLGVDPSRIIIGHLDLADDLDLIFRVLDEGAYVEFDTIGKITYLSDEKRAAFIQACCNKGYSRQMLLSMDITRLSHLAVNGGPGYAYLVDSFLPRLRVLGVSEEAISDMLERNPDVLLGV
ncbi:MAG: phosphotriesterase-related protein [Treponema sp.]|jgi:phosphotriesterase-related protein|nr:phosphotriesterase-related protein [Treponema sp.]